MARTNEYWLAGLQSDASVAQELRTFLVKALSKGFGRQFDSAAREDLVQQSMVVILQRSCTFRGDSQFTTWAASIAVNTALSELRRARHKDVSLQDARVSGEALLREAEAPRGLHAQDAKRMLHGAIESALTDRQREALYAELGGLSPTVLAERMGTSKGALYKLLHDARKRLRAHFELQGIGLYDLVEAS